MRLYIRVAVCLLAFILLMNSSKAFQINYHDTTQYQKLYELFEYEGELELKVPEDVTLGRVSEKLVASEQLGVIVWGEKNRFHVFDSTGNYMLTRDNEGRGPGEIVNASQYSFDNTGKLAVYDQSQLRFVLYDSLFKHTNTVKAGWYSVQEPL